MTSWADIEAKLDGVFHTTHVLYTVAGTAATWDVGYPADLGRAVNPNVWTWQGVSYPANAFPMQPSIDAGDTEFARLLQLQPPTRTWGCIGYSQGAIVTSNILDRIRNPSDALSAYLPSFIGGVTFGNPRREAGHTIPNGIDPGGHGIVTPNLVDTPASWWDFADGKAMVNSPGNDLYCTCGAGEDAQAVADQEAIWELVDSVSLTSLIGSTSLFAELLGLLKSPLPGGIAAIEAIFGALDFFGIEGITPHTSYQFVEPIANDPRDCWACALDYLNELGASVPART